MIAADAIAEFARLNGRVPAEVLVAPDAALVLAAQESLPAFVDGVPLRVAPVPRGPTAPGAATRVALVLAELPGGRVGVVSGQIGPDGAAEA